MFESLTITGTLWYQFVDRTSSLTFVSGLYIIIIGSSVELLSHPVRSSGKLVQQISNSPRPMGARAFLPIILFVQ